MTWHAFCFQKFSFDITKLLVISLRNVFSLLNVLALPGESSMRQHLKWSVVLVSEKKWRNQNKLLKMAKATDTSWKRDRIKSDLQFCFKLTFWSLVIFSEKIKLNLSITHVPSTELIGVYLERLHVPLCTCANVC